ncbi:hypothetical protein NLJ89_g8859 [Agrocybe chaxingu]|uniref:Protein SYM1 n=1 Tax=Agrocybe chaxingu TaxID=84603 RepID=A0A9W8JUM3_9AGAR|nr:hypothetical protein NLJ89_g8859 [Agrocybe chaxingu]
MATQCVTAAVLFGAGDVVAQQAVEGKGKNHDVSTLVLNNSFGLVEAFGGGFETKQRSTECEDEVGDSNAPFARTARLTFYGGALFGPAMTKWYQFLNGIKFPSPTKALMYRLWLDQAILTPVAVAFFYGSMSMLEGKPNEAVDRVKAAYVPTLIRNWGVYIPTQIINFSIIPPHLRFVTVSIVSLFWNTYLSASNASHEKAQRAAEQPGRAVVEKLQTVD